MPAATMEHGASGHVKEQSHTVMTVKAEVDKAAQSTAYRGIQTNVNYTEEKPGLGELVKREPALMVKEEVVEDSYQDMDGERCLQATSTPAVAISKNVAAGSVAQDDGLNIKEEPADTDLDVGPAVRDQHIDPHCRMSKRNVSCVKEERDPLKETPALESEPLLTKEPSGLQVDEDFAADSQHADTEARRSKKASQSKQRAQSQLYSCDKCAKSYTTKGSLGKHNRNRHSTECHKCTKCNKIFPSKQYLYQHTTTVHSEQQYECAVCKKIFKSKIALYQHVYHVYGLPYYRAAADTDDQCGNKAAQSKQPVWFSCDECGKTYASKISLMHHFRNLHSTEFHKCAKCNKKFPSKAYLCNHTRYAHSEQQYECAVCKKMCKSNALLNKHVRQVHQTRPADMDEQRCLQATSTPAIATSMNVVAGGVVQDDMKEEWADTDLDIGPTVLQPMDTPYRPVQPDVSISQQEGRSEDNNINPTRCSGVKEDTIEDEPRDLEAQPGQQAQPRLYRCNKCPRTFKRYSSLRVHRNRDHATGSHECTECKLKYKCADYLASHIRYAHSKVEYECAGCEKMCKTKQALDRHVLGCRELGSAGSRQQFTCSNCRKNYKSKWYWKKHEKSCKYTHPTASDTSAAASTSRQEPSVVIVKEEPADGELELGPVVFQHMDCNYRPYKPEPQLD